MKIGEKMQLTFNVPDASYISTEDARQLFAMKLFEAGKLPLGKAAGVADMAYRDFYDLLTRNGVPPITLTEADVRWECENVRQNF
jgi:predicted HTH domain antitoxin